MSGGFMVPPHCRLPLVSCKGPTICLRMCFHHPLWPILVVHLVQKNWPNDTCDTAYEVLSLRGDPYKKPCHFFHTKEQIYTSDFYVAYTGYRTSIKTTLNVSTTASCSSGAMAKRSVLFSRLQFANSIIHCLNWQTIPDHQNLRDTLKNVFSTPMWPDWF